MTTTSRLAAALALGTALSGVPLAAAVASPASPGAARSASGHEVIELDMATLADPQPGRAPVAPAQAVAVAVPAPSASTTAPARKRFPHKPGVYGDAPLMALFISPN